MVAHKARASFNLFFLPIPYSILVSLNFQLTSLFNIVIIQNAFREETALKHIKRYEILLSVAKEKVSFPSCLKIIIFLK